MTKLRQTAALLVAALLGLGAMYLGVTWKSQRELVRLEPVASLSPGVFYATGFPDLTGKTRTFGEWHGQIVVVNFWATWCSPCREEIPGFVRLQKKFRDKGVTFVGLAIDEKDKVGPYVEEMKINYPILIAGVDATEFAHRAGNTSGGLPFTVIFDRNGKAVAHQLGMLAETQLEKILTVVSSKNLDERR